MASVDVVCCFPMHFSPNKEFIAHKAHVQVHVPPHFTKPPFDSQLASHFLKLIFFVEPANSKEPDFKQFRTCYARKLMLQITFIYEI